jgi:hypothetical protein
MKTISCQAGGSSMPSHTAAWMSTAIAPSEPTEAAIVCM